MNVARRAEGVNVGGTERWLTTGAGVGLLAPLFWRRSKWTVAAAATGAVLIARGATGHSVVYRSLGISSAESETETVEQTITINRPAEELHALWRDPAAFATVTRGVAEITPLDGDHARWTVPLPAGRSLQWETEVVDEQPGQIFHWRSVPDSRFHNEGWLRMKTAPQDRGTEVSLTVAFDVSGLPGGALLQSVASTFSTFPKTAVSKLLRNFKSLAETGEVPTLDQNPSGRSSANGAQGDLV